MQPGSDREAGQTQGETTDGERLPGAVTWGRQPGVREDVPKRLFKYLPSEFVPVLLERGDFLFRSLSYFRKLEEKGRSDLLEGLHRDRPDTPITIERLTDGFKWQGMASCIKRISAERVLVFCLSEIFGDALFTEFSCDACVEILHPDELLRRCEAAISGQPRFADFGLLRGRVEYYAPNRAAQRSITEVANIPFFKHEAYAHQREYRLAVALRGGLRIARQIIRDEYSFESEVATQAVAERHVFVGSIEDLARVHQRS